MSKLLSLLCLISCAPAPVIRGHERPPTSIFEVLGFVLIAILFFIGLAVASHE